LYRDMRMRPALDDKILSTVNALMLKGLSIAATIFQDEKILQQASLLFRFLRENLIYEDVLWVSYKNGIRKQPGFIDDYAYLLDACWYYLQAKWDNEVLATAIWLAKKILSDFWDETGGGFYFLADHHEKLIYRPKIWMDDALPAGAALAGLTLLRF